MSDPKISLNLTAQETNLVLNGLAQLPWGQSNQLILNIQGQVATYQNQQPEPGDAEESS